jgi:Tfp pilus assembly protein PilN
VSVLAIVIFWTYRARGNGVRAALRNLEQRTSEARREEGKFSTEAAKLQTELKGKVDAVNAIIRRKSFSWTDFLTDLESVLPDSSYITSLAPHPSGESSLSLRIRVVSQNLDDLLILYTNLQAKKFGRIKVEGETMNERNELLSEITFTYDKVH